MKVRVNVIKGLEEIKHYIEVENLSAHTLKAKLVIDDAIALLKAQEPVEPKVVDTSNSKLYHNDMFKNHYCGNCGEFLHVVNRKDLFCSQCGRAVKWE